MSIVVKGAKMPNNCGACPLRLAWCRERLYMITRPERCPLEPVRKKGWWVPITESDCSGYDPVLAGYEDPVVGYVCSVCGDGQEKEVMGEPLWNFCPNCGADMRGEEDG